jgi:8-oxo-dGTP pyrophosphatase MutT (NUDIX family)
MVLLTQRTAHLKDHAGQISFPDVSPMAAALREAQEEIGLAAERIEPIGYLDLYLTTFGYRIVPLVARVTPGFSLVLNRDEVDDAFEVPLAFLMAPENHQRNSRDWNGLTRHFYEMPYGERYIWGATAGIVRNLWERIYA